MNQAPTIVPFEQRMDRIYREEWAKVLSVVVRTTRDIDVAEDIAQEAFLRAVSSWQRNGMPPNPGAWLMTTARNIGHDVFRRQQTLARKLPLLVVDAEDDPVSNEPGMSFPDDRLRLILICCHPSLATEARIALSLRMVCGLSTAEIARLFLVPVSTMAARLTRAKHKIHAAGIPFRAPGEGEFNARVNDILAVIYLVYTEGHTAGDGDRLRRPEFTRLASDLVQVMRELAPGHAEVLGLAALIRLTEARQTARFVAPDQIVLFEEMDRSRWDGLAIAEGIGLVEQALRATPRDQPGLYTLQAAIAGVHSEAPSFAETDWPQVVALYTVLVRVNASPIFWLGKALATGMASGPLAGLAELDRLVDDSRIATHSMYRAARADLLRRSGQFAEASVAYEMAAAQAPNVVMAADFRRRADELLSLVSDGAE